MTIVCPLCKGEKRLHAHINYGFNEATGTGDDAWGDVICITCDGNGEITQDHARRIAHGEVLRAERVARGETLYHAAQRLGITPTQLSAIESGHELANH